jgi:hypothetical protein
MVVYVEKAKSDGATNPLARAVTVQTQNMEKDATFGVVSKLQQVTNLRSTKQKAAKKIVHILTGVLKVYRDRRYGSIRN